MSRTGLLVSPRDFDLVEDAYEVRDPAAVRRYLGDHPDLVPLLIEASSQIPTFFPRDSLIALELVTDAEDPDHVNLFALIRAELPEVELLERLDHLDEDWWLDAASRAQGALTIDAEPL